MESNKTNLQLLADNFESEDLQEEVVESMTSDEKIQYWISEFIQAQVRKGVRPRAIKREVFRKTGIKI